jgi:hypothetical protein
MGEIISGCADRLIDWVKTCERVAVSEAATRLPEKPGIYAIFIDHPDSLPEPFRSCLEKRGNQNLIYVGQAAKNLRTRVWKQECLHQKPGSFFRSVGVILGYISSRGGKNFEFDDEDKVKVIEWIKQHLSVGWTTGIEGATIDHAEMTLINQSCPLLNLKHNPQRLSRLRKLRSRSRHADSREIVDLPTL